MTQILAVEILQHRFNLEKMVKISEILLTYNDEGETGELQVQKQQANTLIITVKWGNCSTCLHNLSLIHRTQ